MERCSATVYQPKLSAICQGWENWLMSLGQSSKRKSLMEERKLIQLYSMQKRQGVFAIFICQFSSYQSHPHPTALVYSKKPIQIQYISGSCHPQPSPPQKSVQGTCKGEWRPLLAQRSPTCEIFFFFIWKNQNLCLHRAVSEPFRVPGEPPSILVVPL